MFERDTNNGHPNNDNAADGSQLHSFQDAPSPTSISYSDLSGWNEILYLSRPPMMHWAPAVNEQRDTKQVVTTSNSWWPPQTTIDGATAWPTLVARAVCYSVAGQSVAPTPIYNFSLNMQLNGASHTASSTVYRLPHRAASKLRPLPAGKNCRRYTDHAFV